GMPAWPGRVYGEVDTNAETGRPAVQIRRRRHRQLVRDGRRRPAELDLFLTVLAVVCHTLITAKAARLVLDYQLQSPDEAALVVAGQVGGYEFGGSQLDTFGCECCVVPRCSKWTTFVTSGLLGQERVYKTLAKFEFTSDRKRMSMVGAVPGWPPFGCFMKGADSAIYFAPGQRAPRSGHHRPHGEIRRGRTAHALHSNRRESSRADGSSWRPSTSGLATITWSCWAPQPSRTSCSAVGVPATINDLLLAGIRIWRAHWRQAGDGHQHRLLLRLLQSGMEVRTLTGSGLDDVRSKVAALQSWVGGLEGSSKEPALVVEARSPGLGAAGRSCGAEFLEVCLPVPHGDLPAESAPSRSPTWSDTRVPPPTTLWPEFRSFKKLLFVHGCLELPTAVTIVILFSFYKNLTLYITSFWFAMALCFPAKSCSRSLTQVLYNVFLHRGHAVSPWASLTVPARRRTACATRSCTRRPAGRGAYNLRCSRLWMLNDRALSQPGHLGQRATYFGFVALSANLSIRMLARTSQRGVLWDFDWAHVSRSANFWFLVLLAPLLALTRDLAWTAYRPRPAPRLKCAGGHRRWEKLQSGSVQRAAQKYLQEVIGLGLLMLWTIAVQHIIDSLRLRNPHFSN
uniref:PhoLip_ATPase_C domain-containing protein n=1 Tax=Macrostomum lignano TaxID=282301 RepID=A0A1I8FQE5_9PLAT